MMNEQTYSDLLSQLVTNSLLDVVPILGTNDYSTLDHLTEKAKKYLQLSGGRLTSQELQLYLNVDRHHVDKVIQKIIADTSDVSPVQFTGGELISPEYMDSLVIEIRQIIQRHQRFSRYAKINNSSPAFGMGMLATQYGLPMETMISLVKTHFPDERFLSNTAATVSSSIGNKDKLRNNKKKKRVKTDSSKEDDDGSILLQRNVEHNSSCCQGKGDMAAVFGYCLGAVVPIPLFEIMKSVNITGLDEAGVLNILLRLTGTSVVGHDEVDSFFRLPGICNNKDYIPQVFANQQRIQVDDYFRTNNLVTFSYLESVHISTKQLDYVEASFPDVVALDTCIVSNVVQEVLKASLCDVLRAYPFSEGSNLPPWLQLESALPHELTEEDVHLLLNFCEQNMNSKKSVTLLTTSYGDGFVLNTSFLNMLKEVVCSDASSATTSESLAVASLQIGSSTSSKQASNSISTTTTTSSKTGRIDNPTVNINDDGRGKRGKTKKHGKGSKLISDEVDSVEVSSKAPKKRSGKREKDKSAKKMNALASTNDQDNDDFVSQLISPYISKERLILLFLQSCPTTISDVEDSMAILSSHNLTHDDECDMLLVPLFEAVYDCIFTCAIKAYSCAAEKALESTARGNVNTKMKRELNRDKMFDECWTNLQVSCKILTVLEKDCSEVSPLFDQLALFHLRILESKCAPIALLLTEFCCWEHGIPAPEVPADRISLPFEQRRMLQKELPQDIGNLLAKLWKSLGANDTGGVDITATVWNFMDVVTSTSFKDAFNLVVHKIDKKKEKNLSFLFKQSVMDSLKDESDLEKACCLILSLIMYQHTHCVFEVPNHIALVQKPGSSKEDCDENCLHPLVCFVLAWLKPRMAIDDYNVIQELFEIAKSIGVRENCETIAAKVEIAKQVSMKKPYS